MKEQIPLDEWLASLSTIQLNAIVKCIMDIQIERGILTRDGIGRMMSALNKDEAAAKEVEIWCAQSEASSGRIS